LSALLENHVIPHVICLPAIIGEHKVRTLGSDKLTFDCDRRGTTVEEKRLRSEFLMGQNGVLYMLDDLLLLDRGNSAELHNKVVSYYHSRVTSTSDLRRASHVAVQTSVSST
jgi:hypothetical protein